LKPAKKSPKKVLYIFSTRNNQQISVSDPEWIRIQLGLRIRIPDPGRQNFIFDVPDVPGVWKLHL
jgi:hypothetical protein